MRTLRSVLVLFSWSILWVHLLHAAPAHKAQLPSIGNFLLPTSQEPGPFLSLGQNIIDKNQLQLYLAPNYLKIGAEHETQMDSFLLYGLSDASSILLALPIAVEYSAGRSHSSGLGDVAAQFEYAYYTDSTTQMTTLATIVGGLSLPTGSFNKIPPTGFGAPGFFLGATYNQTFIDWLWFVSPGAILVSHALTHAGSQYYYQFGVGRNLNSRSKSYILSGLLEFDGNYSDYSTISGQINPDSGGNIVYATPSLWLSTKELIIQLGISIPLIQQWNGRQSNTDYFAVLGLGWTFQ